VVKVVLLITALRVVLGMPWPFSFKELIGHLFQIPRQKARPPLKSPVALFLAIRGFLTPFQRLLDLVKVFCWRLIKLILLVVSFFEREFPG